MRYGNITAEKKVFSGVVEIYCSRLTLLLCGLEKSLPSFSGAEPAWELLGAFFS